MKISKNILTSALAVVVTLSVLMVTLLYAYQYTSSHAQENNSFQRGNRNGNGRMPQGVFQKKDGYFKKSGN